MKLLLILIMLFNVYFIINTPTYAGINFGSSPIEIPEFKNTIDAWLFADKNYSPYLVKQLKQMYANNSIEFNAIMDSRKGKPHDEWLEIMNTASGSALKGQLMRECYERMEERLKENPGADMVTSSIPLEE